MVDFTQLLPLELFVGILEHLPIRDLPKLKQVRSQLVSLDHVRMGFAECRWRRQVNRGFRGFVVASPLVSHRIDLCAAGLVYNAHAGASLAKSQEALVRYRSGLDSLDQAQDMILGRAQNHALYPVTGGVCGKRYNVDTIQFFTLRGPASRGTPHQEWKISNPVSQGSYCFYPGADVIAFISSHGSDKCVHLAWKSPLLAHSHIATKTLKSI